MKKRTCDLSKRNVGNLWAANNKFTLIYLSAEAVHQVIHMERQVRHYPQSYMSRHSVRISPPFLCHVFSINLLIDLGYEDIIF